MSRRVAFLFPGQGSQTVGMGRSLWDASDAARTVLRQADDVLGFSLTRLCFEGPEDELRETKNAQPAIFAVSLAALACVRELLGEEPVPDFVAGHSLGEFTALVAAGALTFADGLRLVRRRGELMSAANKHRPGTMAAVLGGTDADVEAACREASTRFAGVVVVANYNSAGQTVISGEPQAVACAGELAKAKGAKRVVPLSVSAAFHSPLMDFAQVPFAGAVADCAWSDPRVCLVANVSGLPLHTANEVREDVTRQIVSPVRWSASLAHMAQHGVDLMVEVGPGQVLSGLAKRVPGIRAITVEEQAGAEAFVAEWRARE
ncbi:MAG: ACP S-malonyltransferase [Chloroflexota bacterium]